MPSTIVTNGSGTPEIVGLFSLAATADLSSFARLDGVGAFELGAQVSLVLGSDLAATANLELAATANLSINGTLDLAADLAAFALDALADLAVAKTLAPAIANFDLSAEATLVTTVAEEFGFTIIVDVLDTAVAAAGNVRRYRPRLFANSAEVPIASFNLNAPTNELGKTFSAALAKADISLVSTTADLDFDLGVWNGSAFAFSSLIENGLLKGRGREIALNSDLTPADKVEISTQDSLAEKIGKAPVAAQIIYNPDLTTETPAADTRSAIQDENGNPILPVITAISGLNLHTVLNRAYVEGCGFSSVVTNLPNIPVSRVEFDATGGYDGGARALLNLFEPIFEAVGNALWILDVNGSIPAGITPRFLPPSAFVRFSDTLPAAQKFDRIRVTYSERTSQSGEYYVDEPEQPEILSNGTFGSSGYTRTEIRRTNRNYRNASNPGVILRSIPLRVETRVYNYLDALVSRETQTEQFDALGKKTGHNRVVEGLMPALPQPDLFLTTIFTETVSIGYQPNPAQPSEQIQSTTTVYQTGLVLIDNDNEDPLQPGQPQKIPLAEAKINYLIEPSANQVIQTQPIRTVKKQLKVLSDGQLNLSVQTYNHLTDTMERTTSEAVPGSNSLGDAKSLSKKTVEIRLTSNPTTRAASFDGGDLPRDVAVTLGRRKLGELNNPRRTASADLPFVDLSIRRGSVFRAQDRASGAIGTFFVTGYSIAGQNLGTQAQTLTMRLEMKEII